MTDLPVPQFVSIDPGQVIAEMKAFYENATGKTLQPAQPEMLVINTLAYREVLQRIAINEASKQNLVQFSVAPTLDYLADLVGVTRIPAQPAVCLIQFTLTGGHGNGVIPSGLRVSSSDGAVVFTTDIQTAFLSTDTQITVACTAQQNGLLGNGYLAGTISTILDPQAFISAAQNTNTTAGGTDDESDENLRSRIILAPNSYSTAGSADSYKFATKTADTGIIDVEVTSPQPGTVNIYPLMAGGVIPSGGILAKVLLACNDEKVRPLTDTVNAVAPSEIQYKITVGLTIYSNADQNAAQQLVNDKLAAFNDKVQNKLGFDVLADKIMGLCTDNDSVYDAAVNLQVGIYIFNNLVWLTVPQIIVTETQFAKCAALSVNVVGLNNG